MANRNVAQEIYTKLHAYRDDDELLERPEEYRLTYLWQQQRDYRARDRIIRAYRRLAASCAKKSARSGLEYDDLVQEATTGMLEALDHFKPELGNGFGTFARFHIINKIQIHALLMVGPLRIFNTAATKSLLAKYNTLKKNIEARTGRMLDDEGRDEICATLSIDRDQLKRYEVAISGVVPLDTGAGNSPDDPTRALELPSGPLDWDGDGSAVSKIAREETTKILLEALATLPQRERQIITSRFLKEPPRTLDSLSKKLNISRERVRQIEIKAKESIGAYMRSRGINSVGDLFNGASAE